MATTLAQLNIGLVGVSPALFLLESSDNYATITAAGYVNTIEQNSVLNMVAGDYVFANYNLNSNQTIFTASVGLNRIVTLNPIAGFGTITGGVNLGAGQQVFKDILAGIMRFRSLVGAGGNVITEDGNQITITGSGTSLDFVWNQVLSTPRTLVNLNGYSTSTGNTPVAFALPATALFGEYYRIATSSSGGWTLSQIGSQQVIFGNASTTIGVTGFLESTALGDSVELLCVAPNTIFQVVGCTGNLIYN